MAALGITDRHDVKEERLHVVIQRFVIQEKFCQQTEILAILLVSLAVYFPYAYLVLPVNTYITPGYFRSVNIDQSHFKRSHQTTIER